MHTQQRGFTLIELMIVVAILGLIASIAVPSLLNARIDANESAAIATLRDIAAAQEKCQASGLIDVDDNEVGEYGFFAELSGAVTVRNDETGGIGVERMRRPFLSAAFRNVQSSRVLRSGYLFQVFLPSASMAPTAETANGGAAGVAIFARNAEMMWCAYAWPNTYRTTGRRAFFVNHAGDVLGCPNTIRRYNGATNPPDGTAAIRTGIYLPNMVSTLAANATGQDEEVWRIVK